MKIHSKKITNATSSKAKVHVGLTGSTKYLPVNPSSSCITITNTFHHISNSHHILNTMTTYTNPTTLFHPQTTTTTSHRRHHLPPIRATFPAGEESQTHRRRLVLATTSMAISYIGLSNLNINGHQQVALAESWGTRSFIKERFFEPGLSPEDAVARIRQTREGLHSIRNMLETMSWRYVLFYIRLKAAYLSQDLKNALSMVPDTRKGSYVKAANELVDNMSEVRPLTNCSIDLYKKLGQNQKSHIKKYYNKFIEMLRSIQFTHHNPPNLVNKNKAHYTIIRSIVVQLDALWLAHLVAL